MSEHHSVSRRASLKTLGAVGAALAFGGRVGAQSPMPPEPAAANARKQAANVVDVAFDRFSKAHS
jgi:hypothetical protein